MSNFNQTQNKHSSSDSLKTAYDNYIYEGYPYAYTRAEHLRMLAVLFGLDVPSLDKARILELGCSTGGNLLAFAEAYPESYSLGIDLSGNQVAIGLRAIHEMGLKNIDLQHLSIMDIDDTVGKFDYIICHGVFSWVPQEVQDRILHICRSHLNYNGLAYVSYNVLPGWNMQSTIRDMMLFHAAGFNNDTDKVSQARALLAFVNESLEGSDSAYAKFLKEETKAVSCYEDQYIRHEYLSEDNIQFYFHQFITMASKHSLLYLGDVNIPSMYLGNLPAKTAQALGSISDIVRTEQYMDFINNRRFRSSVLVHEGRSINRNLSLQSFYKFYTCCPLTPSKPWDSIDPHSQTESIKFISSLGNDASVTVSSPILKATFYTYAENYGNPLTIEEILLIAIDKLGGNIKLQDAKIAFEQVLAPLFLNGHMKLFEVKPKCTNQIQDKPKVSNLARYQARDKSKLWVTSQINERIQLNLHDKYIIELMDGEHTISQIEDHIFEKLKDGTLSAFDDQGKIVSDHNMLERLAAESVKMSLETYRTGFLLI